jgi:ubiquinone/menaquinone biosynthesis C-methylase UbiE
LRPVSDHGFGRPDLKHTHRVERRLERKAKKQRSRMAEELTYRDKAAAEYDRAFAHVSGHFVPFLLRAARIEPGMHVLDIATGTGVAATAALGAVGSTGFVFAADVSAAMVEQARRRLGAPPNVRVAVEDGQSLSFVDGRFDAVICSLGLMFFPDAARGVSEFRRVLRPGGRAAASVLTVPERSYNGRINAIMARHVPRLAEATARTFSLGDAAQLRSVFEAVGFGDVEITTEIHRFQLPSFDAYFGPFERGGASTGQAYVNLPEGMRGAIREEMRRSLGDTGGPIEIEVEFRYASGQR